MLKKTISLATISLCALGLVACDVDKTQEGNLDLPKYEVEQTRQGQASLPRYDVDGPDVNVRTEQRTVEVPRVEITPPKEDSTSEGR